MSHGPMVARRLGIPCVSGVEEIWDYISDGDTLIVRFWQANNLIFQVRANSGTVQILGKTEKPKKPNPSQIYTQAELHEMTQRQAFDDLPPHPGKE